MGDGAPAALWCCSFHCSGCRCRASSVAAGVSALAQGRRGLGRAGGPARRTDSRCVFWTLSRTVALFGPQSLRWRAPRRGTEPRPRGCGEAGACRARMVTLGGAALRHSDSTSQCAPVAPRPLRSCAFPSPPPRRCVGIRSALARPVLLLWLSLSRLSTHTRPTLLSQPLRAPQTPLIPTTHCWPRSDCSARATDRRASSHSLRLSHVLHPR